MTKTVSTEGLNHLVDVKTGFEEAALALHDRRLDRVLHEADLVSPHVVLDVNAQVFATQPRKRPFHFSIVANLNQSKPVKLSLFARNRCFIFEMDSEHVDSDASMATWTS